MFTRTNKTFTFQDSLDLLVTQAQHCDLWYSQNTNNGIYLIINSIYFSYIFFNYVSYMEPECRAIFSFPQNKHSLTLLRNS